MKARGKRPNGTDPPVGEALSRIEAALQAGLGPNGSVRPDLARKALVSEAEPSAELEMWLEAVAAQLRSDKAAVVPEELVEAIAERMMANRKESLGAHRRIDGSTIQGLVRSP